MLEKQFPYIDTSNDTKWNKTKYPCRIDAADPASKYYKENGHEVISVTDMQEGPRFNKAKITLKKPNGVEYVNSVTLSPPVAEGLGIRKKDGDIQICLLLQTRTPYNLEVDGKTYARIFQEMIGGLADKGETLEEVAIREIEEETGHKVKALHKLIKPFMHKHTSYTDETSLLFYAVLGEFIGQKLDENEDIKANWYSISKVEEEFEDYLEGRKPKFFGFDMSEMLILALQRFFVKYCRGEIEI